jgi:hypothetical protein
MSLATASRRLRSAEPGTRINLVLAALLWSYTVARAARLSFTHDESLTYLLAVKRSYLEIARYQVGIPSNNHLLNSTLAKLCTLLGRGPFALRLPNLLAHGLYLVAALLLARRAGSGPTRVLAFVVLTLNPFLLDFFSLCRGYGLACGFELMALYLLVKVAEAPRNRPLHAGLATLLAALSPLSNLSFLVFFLAYLGILLLIEIAKWRAARGTPEASSVRALVGSLGLPLAIAGLVCAWLVPIGLKLREMGELYYGGDQGFLQDTLGSLLEASTYYKPYPAFVRLALQLVGALSAAAALALAARLARQRRPLALWLCALPLATALICVVQHQLMETKFPVDRTALFFVPMLGLALAVASADAGTGAAWARAGQALLGVATLLLVLNAARTLNLRYFAQWQYDANTSRMLRQLAKTRGAQRKVRLGVNWLFTPSINYYREQRRLKWLEKVTRSGLHEDADYYYYLPEDSAITAQRTLQPLQHDEVSQATLARRLP